MSDGICSKCGRKGYQGLFVFECLNPLCSESSSAKSVSGNPSATLHPPTVGVNLNPTPGFVAAIAAQVNCGLTFLKKIEKNGKIASKAVIAGGAPRDWFFSKEARDIDVFVKDFNEAEFTIEFLGANISLASKKTAAVYAANSSSNSSSAYGNFKVWDVFWQGQKFQIIDVKGISLEDHIRAFDFGINMISMDSTGAYKTTSEFKHDVSNKLLTVYTKRIYPKSFRNLGERYRKLKQKFPDFILDMK